MTDVRALLSQARALKAAGRLEEALSYNRRAALSAPDSGVAAHNLAATLGDLCLFAEAEAWTRLAMERGANGPETWLVRARALQGLARLDEAEEAFQTILRLRPDYLAAHHDLAQLRWMRSADLAGACASLDAAPAAVRHSADLMLLRAHIQMCAQDHAGAAATLDRAIAVAPAHAGLRIARAQLAAERGDAALHLEQATSALSIDRASHEAAKCVLEALLHAGRAREAEQLALRIQAAVPGDQGIVALLATAWRLMGDGRHEALCADPALISAETIGTPPGWPDLAAYLRDLAAALAARHIWTSHPLEQSLRHGSQTQEDLTRSGDPAIKALFVALRPLIERHIDALAASDDPARRRVPRGFRIGAAWSVALRPGGFHKDHVHPRGWLSSAFYVSLPDAVEEGRQGWLAFGRPGIPTRPSLAPFHHIRPKPGMLAIFPSYLWHGTEPFSGEQKRLTVAFDILPG